MGRPRNNEIVFASNGLLRLRRTVRIPDFPRFSLRTAHAVLRSNLGSRRSRSGLTWTHPTHGRVVFVILLRFRFGDMPVSGMVQSLALRLKRRFVSGRASITVAARQKRMSPVDTSAV
jgi:hypothetical protein